VCGLFRPFSPSRGRVDGVEVVEKPSRRHRRDAPGGLYGGPAPKKKVASRAEVVDLLRKVDENLSSAPVEDDDDDVVDLTV